MSIKTLMNKEVVAAHPDETVEMVARRMSGKAVGAVVLLEAETLAGLFTERDLLTRVVAEGRDPAATRVGDVATHDLVTMPADASVRQCAEELKVRNVRHLPIVEGGRLVGIISARDFFAVVAGEFEKLLERARYDEQLREDIDPYDHMGGAYGR